jgi:hypothetical protein
MVAISGLALLHVPPGVELKSEVDEASHTTAVPVILLGIGFTVIRVVARQPGPTW